MKSWKLSKVPGYPVQHPEIFWRNENDRLPRDPGCIETSQLGIRKSVQNAARRLHLYALSALRSVKDKVQKGILSAVERII